MNALPGTERDATLIANALAAFTHVTGLPAEATDYEKLVKLNHRPDATIVITLGKQRFEFIAEAKLTLDRAVTLAAVKEHLTPYGERGVLITPYLTADLATKCREQLQLQFIDTAGNAYIQRGGLYIYVKGERLAPGALRTQQTKGGTATRLRVVFALLCDPRLFNAPYRDIAKAADVALGTVGWTFFDLEHRHFLIVTRNGRTRRLIEPARLLDEWVTNYPIKLRPKLNPQRFLGPNDPWWQHALTGLHAYWGGEVAAQKLTKHLKPANCTLYVDPHTRREIVKQLVTKHRLRQDPHGNVEMLDAFWNLPANPIYPHVVPPILAYADLVATLDPRNLEVAQMIRTQHIDNALRKT
jgi:hypothetical protein